MTEEEKKQAEAKKLEVKVINRKIEEHREQIKLLLERKRELKERHGKKKWDESTPLFKFVKTSQSDVFNVMLKNWGPYLKEIIGTNVKKVNYFKFDLSKARNKAIIIRSLKIAQTHDPIVFTLSERGLSSYLSEHSNLGSASSIKKALQRCDLKKWGHNNSAAYVTVENADV